MPMYEDARIVSHGILAQASGRDPQDDVTLARRGTTDQAWQRSFDLCRIADRLVRWRRPADAASIERAYDAALARLSSRLRIVHRPGLPLMRSKLPWIVQKRRGPFWRIQGTFGTRQGFDSRRTAESFLALCLHVDARDEAFEALRAS